MIPYKLSDQIKFEVPSSIEEITLYQYVQFVQLEDKKDEISISAIMSGVPRETWLNVVMDPVSEARWISSISWLNDAFSKIKFKSKLPEKITVGGKSLDIPKDLSVLSYGQKSNLKKISFAHDDVPAFKYITSDGLNVTGLKDTVVEIFAKVLAIYLQPLYDEKPFDDGEPLRKVTALCEKIPAITALPIANFFLRSYLGLKPWKPASNIRKTGMQKKQEPKTLHSSEISS